MAHNERSAGFVIFHDDERAGRRFLLLDYGRHWDFPKGHVETGEDDLTAALRELKEETAISNPHVLDGFREEVVYFFRHPKRGLIRKVVVFFLAQTPTLEVTLSNEHSGFSFENYVQARSRLTFPSARKILDGAHGWLSPPTVMPSGDKVSEDLFP